MKASLFEKILFFFIALTPTFYSAQATGFTVTNTADAGAGSLREAITLANADNTASAGAPHTIDLTGISGSITLITSLPAISWHININGPGSATLTLTKNASSSFRIFTVNAGYTVSVSGLTMNNGKPGSTGGGAIYNEGTLTLNDCIMHNNDGGFFSGGAIHNNATITLNNCTLRNNTSSEGGAIYNNYNAVSCTLNDCIVFGNTSNSGSAAFTVDGGILICNNSLIKGNTSSSGEAIMSVNTGNFAFNTCTLDSNKTTMGDVILIVNPGITTNTFTNSTISRNISQNGLSFLSMLSGVAVTITNCTISENTTTTGDGAIDNKGGHLTLMNCTITKNTNSSSGRVGGLYSSPGSTPGTNKISNTIIAGNTKGGVASDVYVSTPMNYPSGHNIFGTATFQGILPTGDTATIIKGVTASSVLNLTLADNGGPTKTHALVPCSYAINAGTENGAPVTDQRGTARADSIDIGAFESPAASTGKPFLTSTHANKIVCSGATTIKIYISGMGLSYQWQVNTGSGLFNNIPNTGIYSNSNTSELHISSVTGLNNYQYRCVVTGPCAFSLTSVPSSLKITNAPAIGTQPSNQFVCTSSFAQFTVTATGSGLTYKWQADQGLGFNDLTDGSPYSGTSTSALGIAPASLAMSGYSYRCVVTNACTTIYSDAATLNVSSTPGISFQPSNATICPGSDAGFNISASGSAITYQWQVYNGTTFVNVTNTGVYSGNTSATLVITGAPLSMDGFQYRCQVINPCTTLVSDVVTLTVTTGITINTQPASHTVCPNENTSMTTAVTGASAYQWQVDTGTGFTNITDNATYVNSSSNTLDINTPSQSMTGYIYRCVISAASCTGVDVNSSEAILTVRPNVAIDVQPVSRTLCAGSNTTYNIQATGVDVMYQWQVNTGSGYTNIINSAAYSNATTATLGITAANAQMNGYFYRCIVSDPCASSVTSNEVSLTVNAAPTVTAQPLDTIVYAGTNAKFIATTTGPVVNYQWQVNSGSGFTNLSNIGIYNNVTTATLSITGASKDEDGNLYRCILTGACGAPVTTASAALHVITQEICYITVDDATKKNMIVFGLSDPGLIDSFRVYREGTVTGQFDYIGRAGTDDASFIDPTSDPVQQPYIYKLAVRTKDGIISDPGDPHRTMHLSINKGPNNTTWNLIWTAYQGIPVSTYNIYRGLLPSSMTLINSVAGSVNSFTDASAPLTTNIYYQIEITGDACDPNARMAAGSTDIRSNIAETENAVTAVTDQVIADKIKVYPNPAKNNFYVEDLPNGTYLVKILDMMGQQVHEVSVENNRAEAHVSALPKGMYLIEIVNSENIVVRKKIFIE